MENKIELNERLEVFKEIPSLPGYFASNDGRVRRGLTKIIKTHENRRGYVIAQIMMDKKRVGVGVHRLVAMAFLGNLDGMEVDHLNSDKKDNRVENLEIVTRAENMRRFHSSENGTASYLKISEGQTKRWDRVGRKTEEEKYSRAQITMTPEQYKATAKGRSGMVRRALDKHLASISEERIERAAKMQRAAIPELHEFLRVRREIISRGGSLDQIENVNDWIRTLLAV